MMNNKVKGIYIHIPFCNSICFYCDFPKVYYQHDLANQYLEQLIKEINSYQINHQDIESIYIGGGTPSVLTEQQLIYLFEHLNIKQYTNLQEFTIEVNPESLTSNKIDIFKKYNINRISIGVQTFDDDLLKHLNRKHTQKQVIDKITYLQNNGFTNISVDLIMGLKNQTKQMIINDLEIIKQLNIKHLAYYNLIIEPGTVFYNENYQEQDDYFQTEVSEYLKQLDFERYEVSNYSKDNHYSKHNLLYWRNERYYGFGLGAGGFLKNYRYYNTRSITDYLKGKHLLNKEYYLNQNDYLKDEIMLNFRIFNGIDLNHYDTKYNLNFTKYFNNVIISNKDKLYIKDDNLYFTNKGQCYLNDLIIAFMDEVDNKED